MAAAEDVLVTRLEVAGLAEYSNSFGAVLRSLRLFSGELNEAARSHLALGVAAGAAAIAVGDRIFEMAKMAGEEDAAIQRASASFEQYGHSFPEAALEAFGNRIQDTTTVAREQAIALAGLMGAYGLTRQQAETLTPAILNASEALKTQGVSAEALTSRIAKALERARMGDMGGITSLKRLGIIVNEAKAAADPLGAILDALNKKGGDQAAMFRSTLPGALEATHNSWTRLQEDVGRVFEGPFRTAAQTIGRFIDVLDRTPGAVQILAAAAVFAAVRLGIMTVQNLIAIRSLAGLAAAHLEAAAAARVHAAAEAQAAGATGAAGTAASTSAVPMGGKTPGRAAGFGTAIGETAGVFRAPVENAPGSPLDNLMRWIHGLTTGGAAAKTPAEAHTEAAEKLAKSMDDLRNSNLELVKNMQNYLGGAGGAYVRDVLGDSAIVEAFARGIA